jgi:hypothetical protein
VLAAAIGVADRVVPTDLEFVSALMGAHDAADGGGECRSRRARRGVLDQRADADC